MIKGEYICNGHKAVCTCVVLDTPFSNTHLLAVETSELAYALELARVKGVMVFRDGLGSAISLDQNAWLIGDWSMDMGKQKINNVAWKILYQYIVHTGN